jgi:subtilisin family serine protease
MSRSHIRRKPYLLAAALPAAFVALVLLTSLVRGGGTDLRLVAGVPIEDDSAGIAAATDPPALSSAWDWAATRLPGTLVAVVDTGVAPTPDLAGRVDSGQSFVGGEATADENGHGTAVAGIIAGSTGVCQTCRILPLRVSPGATGSASSENIAAAVDAAVAHGAAVVNLSMVSSSPTDAEQGAIARAVAAGVVVVAAVGNAASSTPMYPASYAGVLSVGATGDDGAIAGFSNRGPWVSVLAPGCGPSHAPEGGQVLFCGTSASAPYVAGVAAVLRAAVPTAAAPAVIAAIRRSSRPADGAADGIIDPAAALVAIGGVPAVSTITVPVPPPVKAAAPKLLQADRAGVTRAIRFLAQSVGRPGHTVRARSGVRHPPG